jgi:hypothetical protein
MVLALSAMALPDAGTTGSTLGASMAYALHKGDTATRASATMAAVGNLDTAALYEHRKPVALAAYDLGDPEADINVEIQGDSDVARWQGGKGILSVLYEEISKRKEEEKRNNVR